MSRQRVLQQPRHKPGKMASVSKSAALTGDLTHPSGITTFTMLPRVVDVRTVQAGNGDGKDKLEKSKDGVYNPSHKTTVGS